MASLVGHAAPAVMESSMLIRPLVLAMVILGLATAGEAGVWKTAYVKRGWVGMFEAGWAAGIGGTQRMRTTLRRHARRSAGAGPSSHNRD